MEESEASGMNMGLIVGLLVIILVVLTGYYFWSGNLAAPQPNNTVSVPDQIDVQVDTPNVE